MKGDYDVTIFLLDGTTQHYVHRSDSEMFSTWFFEDLIRNFGAGDMFFVREDPDVFIIPSSLVKQVRITNKEDE